MSVCEYVCVCEREAKNKELGRVATCCSQMRFPHWGTFCEVLMLVGNNSTRIFKLNHNAENSSVNEMWQLAFKKEYAKNCLKEILGKQAENCCIKKKEKIFKITILTIRLIF